MVRQTVDYEDWLDANLSWLIRLATALAGPNVAEDIAQDVAIKVQRHWAMISRLDHPRSYLRRMVVNEHLSLRRRWRLVPIATFTEVDLGQLEGDPGEPGIAQRYADRAQLSAEIRRLPPRQRAVIVLRYLEELEDGEIAEVLGCSQSTVRSHVARGLAALRVQITTSIQENTHAH